MTDTPETPLPRPRLIGAVYLLYFLTAFLAMFLARGIFVPNQATLTAANILEHQGLYRSALAVDLIGNILYVCLTALLYHLLGPVNWRLSLVAAFISLVGCGVQVFAGALRLAPLTLLTSTQLAQVFGADQLRSMALLCLTIHAQTFTISLVLFGVYDVLLGVLVFRSSYLPRFIGVLLMCAGIGWLAFLWPPLASAVASVVLPLGAIAEIVIMLWLLIRGVDVSKWEEKARSGSSGKTQVVA